MPCRRFSAAAGLVIVPGIGVAQISSKAWMQAENTVVMLWNSGPESRRRASNQTGVRLVARTQRLDPRLVAEVCARRLLV